MHLHVKKTHVHAAYRCFPDSEINGAVTFNMAVIQLGVSTLKSNCRQMHRYPGNALVHCHGERKFVLPTRHVWRVSFLHQCSKKRPLNIRYNITMKNQRISQPRPIHPATCRSYLDYNLTAVPNLLGLTKESEMIVILGMGEIVVRNALKNCYQHIYELGCRWLFPEYRDGRLVQFCKGMCEDFVRGCENQLMMPGSRHFIHCPYLQDSKDPDVCVYKPVLCPRLRAPANGSFELSDIRRGPSTEARYSCDTPYQISADSTVRICQYSGKWTGTRATCQFQVKSRVSLAKTVVVDVGTLLLLTGVVFAMVRC